MPELSICLATDAGYLFPTFASAVWLRERVPVNDADVTIIGVDLDAATHAAFAPFCEALGISLLLIPRARIAEAPPMFARLFLAELLPAHITRFLYLDGDTQYPGSLSTLLGHRPPPGQFLAVRDPIAFTLPGRDRVARQTAAHFEAIGLSREDGERYFNSGVILADREGWAAIGHAAWRLADASGGTRFPDQDALNLVARGRHLPLSLAWNFPAYLMNARLEGIVQPHIIHYMSSPKPWHGAFPPWTAAEHAPYEALIRRFPALTPYLSRMPLGSHMRYQVQQRLKRILETVTWGSNPRRERLIAYEREALLHPWELAAA